MPFASRNTSADEMVNDMFLEIFALVWLVIVVVLMVYIFFYIHDIPYEIAKHRNHPHRDAIHAGCWLSLFTLHAIWPLIFMWALTHPKPGEAGSEPALNEPGGDRDEVRRLKDAVAALDRRIAVLEPAPIVTATLVGGAIGQAESMPVAAQKNGGRRR